MFNDNTMASYGISCVHVVLQALVAFVKKRDKRVKAYRVGDLHRPVDITKLVLITCGELYSIVLGHAPNIGS